MPTRLKQPDRCLVAISCVILMLGLPLITLAAGLGEVQEQSALGQPLRITVATDDFGEDSDQLRARIADEAAYTRLGLVRDASLAGASVTLETVNGSSHFTISSPVRAEEPILDVVLEITHRNTRILRAYNLLLDPPTGGSAPLLAADYAASERGLAVPSVAAPAAVPVERPRGLRERAATTLSVRQPRPETRWVPDVNQAFLSLRLFTPVPPAGLPLSNSGVTRYRPSRLHLAQQLQSTLSVAGGSPGVVATPIVAAAPLVLSGLAVVWSIGPLWWLLAVFAGLGLLLLQRRAHGRAGSRPRPLPPQLPQLPQLQAPEIVNLPSAVITVPRATAPVLAATARPERRMASATPGGVRAERRSDASRSPDLSGEAAGLIATTLLESPDRNDLRYKLLQLHHADGNTDSFIDQAEEFALHLGQRDDPHWLDVVRMGRDLAPGLPLFHERAELPRRSDPAVPRLQRYFEMVDSRALKAALDELHDGHQRLRQDSAFIAAFLELMTEELGRPTALEQYHALSAHLGGAQIYAKREDLRRRGSEARIHVYGQVLLAKYMGKKTVVAASRQGRHGEALVTAAKALGMKAVVYLPEQLLAVEDDPAVAPLRSGGGLLIPVPNGENGEVPDARRQALEHWLRDRQQCAFVSSLRAGPAPMPEIINDFQSVVGQEIRRNWYRRLGHLPEALVCHAHAGYATFGFTRPFLEFRSTRIDCVTAARAPKSSKFRQSSADHPFQRELAELYATGRVGFPTVSARAVSEAARLMDVHEQFSTTAENLCALAHAIKLAKTMTPDQAVVLTYG